MVEELGDFNSEDSEDGLRTLRRFGRRGLGDPKIVIGQSADKQNDANTLDTSEITASNES
jgi:hypothetical protein